MVGDHALGSSRGARGVIQRDGLGLVVGQCPLEDRIAARDERFVFDLAQALTGSGVERIVNVDDEDLLFQFRERRADDTGIHAIGDENLGAAMLEDVGDRLGVQARVDRIQHRTEHWHTKMCVEHRRHVRQHHRHHIALAHATLGKR